MEDAVIYIVWFSRDDMPNEYSEDVASEGEFGTDGMDWRLNFTADGRE